MNLPTDGKDKLKRELSRLYMSRYSAIPENRGERILEQIGRVISICTDPDESLKVVLNEASTLIHRMLGMKQISVALRDPKDGCYKYVHFLGLTSNAVIAYKKISYKQEDLMDFLRWPRIRVTDTLHFFPTEFAPYVKGEEETFNKPSKLRDIRKSDDDMLDDDYIDVFMYDQNRNLVGYIELSGTKDDKIPSRESMKWIDFLAQLLGKTIRLHQE